MLRLVCPTVTAAAAAAGALIAVAAPASAQESCNTLPNPIVVTTSPDLEPLLKELGVKLAAESQPATIVIVSLGSVTKACSGVQSIVSSTDFGGAPGRYYTLSDGVITPKSCSFSAGQTAHVAITEVFYESCSAVAQPKPADIADVLGPVLPITFVVPSPPVGSTTYVTYEEARTVFGCGVSSMRTVAGVFDDPQWVFCRDPAAGTQISLARNLDLSNSMFPGCRFYNSDGKLVSDLMPRGTDTAASGDDWLPTKGTIGFAAVGEIERNRAAGYYLAFQARGQTLAFYPDSRREVTDRANVRDGHYPLWAYVHFITRTSGGSLSPQVSALIDWINGTKTSPKLDHLPLDVGVGLIPQCAMKVKRASDGGPLSPYSPPKSCHCGFEARAAKITPVACTPCVSDSTCTGGLTCRHGFCE